MKTAAELPTTMNVLRAHHRGGAEQLVYEQTDVPEPGTGELLVEVHAAAITFAELTWDLSWTRDGLDRTPITPSHEFSGVVVGRGPGQPWTAPQIGDAVFGLVPFDRDGAAAEYVSLPTANVGPKPARLSHVETSALPLAAATAWQALVRHAGVRFGERVLVLGGAGAVGSFAVQIGLAMGADVTATVLSSHLEFAHRLGLEHVIDVGREEFDVVNQQYDIVLDTVGGDTLTRAYATLRPGGRLVTLQAPPDPDLARAHGVEAVFFVVGADRETLDAVSALAAAGQLHVEIAATYPLAAGRAAYESGATFPRPPGKTVIAVR